MTATRLSPTVFPGLAARAASAVRALLAREHEDGVFLVTLRGRVHGVLRRDPAGWRLGWLDDADARLASFGTLVPDDLAATPALAHALARRLGRPDSAALRVTPVLAF